MKRLALYSIIFSVACAVIIPWAIAGHKTIRVNKTCDGIPGLKMTQVTITDDRTLVDFEWENRKGDFAISLYAPDNESAFVIKDRRSAKTYRLRSAEGIATYPQKDTIKEGEIKTFTLIFDKMPYHYINALEDAAELIVSTEYY